MSAATSIAAARRRVWMSLAASSHASGVVGHRVRPSYVLNHRQSLVTGDDTIER